MTVISFGNHKDFNFLITDTFVVDKILSGSTYRLQVEREENKIRYLNNFKLVFTLSGNIASIDYIERYIKTINDDIFSEDIRNDIIHRLNENVRIVPKLAIKFVFLNNKVVGEWDIEVNENRSRFTLENQYFTTYNENIPKLIWFGLNIACEIELSEATRSNVVRNFFYRMREIHNLYKTGLIPQYDLTGLETSELIHNSHVILFKDGTTPPVINLYNKNS